MSDTDQDFSQLDPATADVAFSQPAIFFNRIAITEEGGIFRLAAMEEAPSGTLTLRGAVAMSTDMARQIARMLSHMIEKVDERNG